MATVSDGVLIDIKKVESIYLNRLSPSEINPVFGEAYRIVACACPHRTILTVSPVFLN